MTVKSSPRLALLAACVALSALPAGAERRLERLQLRGGATIEAPVLKEGADNVFLDLGFDVLSVPAGAIVESLPAEPVSDATTTTPAGAGAGAAFVEAGGAGESFASIQRMLDDRKRSVVVVSNPGGYGAGFIIDRRGRVLSNHHVVRNQQYHAVTLVLRGEDGVLRRRKIEDVELVAFSREMDIALLQMPPEALEGLDLPPLALGDYDSLSAGDPVYAIGNPGLGRQMLDHTVSEGIVSNSARNIGDILYVQTTAPVNPGNSGGPLIDVNGHVVGLVTLKAIFHENIAFALPANYIRLFLQHEKAYAFDKNNPNYSYRYLDPE